MKTILHVLSRIWVALLLGGVFGFMLTVKPTVAPAPWFDEGWTLSVARNWVEKGVYARLLLDQPVTFYDTAWPFPVTGLVGVSFRLFGVGVLQGRLPIMLYTIGCLGLLYLLARQLYGQAAAGVSLLVAIFASVNLHVVFMGRQAIAEMPMLFFLFLGLVLWLPALKGSILHLVGAALSWGLAITIKQHPLPFIVFMLAITAGLAVLKKNKSTAWTASTALVGTLLAYAAFYTFDKSLSAGLPAHGEPTEFLYTTSVLVLDSAVRAETLLRTLTLGLPVLSGLAYAAWKLLQAWRAKETDVLSFARAGYLLLTVSWLGWYTLLSIGWPKYYFPVGLLGNIAVAVLLLEFTQNLNLPYMARSLGGSLRSLRPNRRAFQVLLAIIFLIDGLVFTFFFGQYSLDSGSDAAYQVQEYIHQQTPERAVIETYDSEMLFLLNRPIHFPPDHIQMELNRRNIYNLNSQIPYDPLASDPDYLVVGPWGRTWKLYEPVITAGAFTEVFSAGGYQVYQRER